MTLKLNSLIICILVISGIFQSCVNAVEPEFDYQDNILFIDAYALTEAGLSYVSIKRSIYELGDYRVEKVRNAHVKLENVDTGSFVNFSEDSGGDYICPADFRITTGETWKMNVELEDGSRYESKAETVIPAVPIDNIEAEFSLELKYADGFNKYRYLPGHSVRINWQDPIGEKNYYLWKYRSFEPITICKTCYEGMLRDEVCIGLEGPGGRPPYYDYLCETDCWMIRLSDELPIFDDQFSDGIGVASREVAKIPYYRPVNILVEIQQLSLSKSAYEYFEILDQLLTNSSGLNAPPPAPLFGNLYNPDDETDIILGHFTATGVSTKRIFIDRSDLPIEALDRDHTLRFESCFGCPTTFPCKEGLTRTAIEPEGWL